METEKRRVGDREVKDKRGRVRDGERLNSNVSKAELEPGVERRQVRVVIQAETEIDTKRTESEGGHGGGEGCGGREKGASVDLLPTGSAPGLCDCRLRALSQLPTRRYFAQEREAREVDTLHAGNGRVGPNVWLQNPGASGQDWPVVRIVQVQNWPWDPSPWTSPCRKGPIGPSGAACALSQWDAPASTADLLWTPPPTRAACFQKGAQHVANVVGPIAPVDQEDVSILPLSSSLCDLGQVASPS